MIQSYEIGYKLVGEPLIQRTQEVQAIAGYVAVDTLSDFLTMFGKAIDEVVYIKAIGERK